MKPYNEMTFEELDALGIISYTAIKYNNMIRDYNELRAKGVSYKEALWDISEKYFYSWHSVHYALFKWSEDKKIDVYRQIGRKVYRKSKKKKAA